MAGQDENQRHNIASLECDSPAKRIGADAGNEDKIGTSMLKRSRDELHYSGDSMEKDMQNNFEIQPHMSSHALEEGASKYLWLVYKSGD